MRRVPRVEVFSGIKFEGATVLDNGDILSPGTIPLSSFSRPALNVTGNSNSLAL